MDGSRPLVADTQLWHNRCREGAIHPIRLRPVPMAAIDPGLRRDDKEEGSIFSGRTAFSRLKENFATAVETVSNRLRFHLLFLPCALCASVVSYFFKITPWRRRQRSTVRRGSE